MSKKPNAPTASEIGRKGGKSRMAKLTKAERQALARLAAETRWAKAKARKKPSPPG